MLHGLGLKRSPEDRRRSNSSAEECKLRPIATALKQFGKGRKGALQPLENALQSRNHLFMFKSINMNRHGDSAFDKRSTRHAAQIG